MEVPITIDDIHGLMSDLRRMALGLLQMESDAHSVSPTALVMTGLRRYRIGHQEWSEITWKDRHHCFATLHLMMRRALIDYARKRAAKRRPPLVYLDPTDVNFYDMGTMLKNAPEQIVALEEALQWLESRDAELARLIEYHYFSGIGLSELATCMEVSTRTLKRRLDSARLLLHKKVLDILDRR